MRLSLPISVACDGVVTHLGPVGGVTSDSWGAQAVQPREASLSQLAALLAVGVKTCVYMMTTISLNY